MRTLEPRLEKHIDLLISRYPALGEVKQAIIDAYLVMEECYEHDGKLLIAGNGGSAADSEHIAGKTAFDVIDETLYGKAKFEKLEDKIQWVCEHFEVTEKSVESDKEWHKRIEDK